MTSQALNASAPSLVVVLNPTAGRGRGGQQRARLETALRATFGEAAENAKPVWKIVETQQAGDGTRLAAQAAAQGAAIVAAAGGDGTLGEVLNGIAQAGVRLGLIPMGTGNDFARALGLVPGDIAGAVQVIQAGHIRRIDLGHVVLETGNDRWFINIAGCGFDAVVADRVNRGFRFLRGTAAYIGAVISCLFTYRAARLRLTLDEGKTRELRAMLCAVANAPMYGGGMRVAPDAQIDDGCFDICLLAAVGKIEFLRAFPRVFRGTHTSHLRVTMLRAQQVRVESDPALPLLVDGDIVGTTPATFRLAPAALEILAPLP